MKRCPARYCPRLTNDRYCPEHMAQYEAKRGTSKERGYDAQHRALRAWWQERIDKGEIVHCADGCGQRITGRAWHLGHTPDRAGYLGPQTIGCNTSDGGKEGRARQE